MSVADAEADPLTSYELKQSITVCRPISPAVPKESCKIRTPVRRPIGVSQGHLTLLKSRNSSVQLSDDVIVRPVTVTGKISALIFGKMEMCW